MHLRVLEGVPLSPREAWPPPPRLEWEVRMQILTKFDDYPIQQTSEPLSILATSERNAYGRYWFNGYDPDGEFYFGIAFAVYPHRQIMDCALSIVRRDGSQDSFRASRRLRGDRTDLSVGPMRLEIIEPMRTLRVTIDSNRTGITADLLFQATSPVHMEPLDEKFQESRRVVQVSRYTQFGMWSGHIDVNGRKQAVDGSKTHGLRDRSWGFRPCGEPETGVETSWGNQMFWLWAPISWSGRFTHYGLFEHPDGSRWKEFAQVFPRFDSGSKFDTLSTEGFQGIVPGAHNLSFEEGSRYIKRAEIELHHPDGRHEKITMKTILRFHMYGIGYGHPDWGHGQYKGDEELTSEHWNVNDIAKTDRKFLHIQNVVRCENGSEVGHGVIEQAIFGPHQQYGFGEGVE